MTLTSGIEQHTAARSLTSVHHVPSPHPSIELRRVKHAHAESDTQDVAGVRGADSEGSSTGRDLAQSVSPGARKRLEVQYACLCFALFLAGWNDGTNGPLIPRIQRYYNVSPSDPYPPSPFLSDRAQVNFTLVSLIFITNCVVSMRSRKE
jgi:hypothetical protein